MKVLHTLILAMAVTGPVSAADWQALPETAPAPADNPTTPAKVELGKMLYMDPRFSSTGTVSCNSCHNRGKRIGVSYQGIMEFPYGSPYDAGGGKQPKLHTKKYLFISDDLHHQKASRKENPEGGLLCRLG